MAIFNALSDVSADHGGESLALSKLDLVGKEGVRAKSGPPGHDKVG